MSFDREARRGSRSTTWKRTAARLRRGDATTSPLATMTAIAVVVLAACGGGGGEADSPQPATDVVEEEPGAGSPEPADEGTALTGRGSERPVSLPLDDLEPCDLLTPSIRRRFGLRTKPRSDLDGLGQPTCQVLAGPPGGYVIGAAHSEGMESFEGIPEEMAAVRPLTIAGFPAAELKDASYDDSCLIGTEVADGQHLAVFNTEVPEAGTQDEICSAAVDFSTALLEELAAR